MRSTTCRIPRLESTSASLAPALVSSPARAGGDLPAEPPRAPLEVAGVGTVGRPLDVAPAPRSPLASASFFAPKAEAGAASVRGIGGGGYVRLSFEALFVGRRGRASLAYGVGDACEFWKANEAGGFSLPFVLFAGVHTPDVLATVGAGLNALTIDGVNGQMGAGGLSPRAQGRVAVKLGSMLVGVDLEAQRRWQQGVPSLTMLQAGVSIGLLIEGDRMP